MGHTQQRVSLRGCVQAAPGFDEFILHRVGVWADRLAEQEAIAERALILPGSWVRLQGGAGRPALLSRQGGLAGRANRRQWREHNRHIDAAAPPKNSAMPPSSVPPPASDANGAPPQITVEQIGVVGQTCD